MRTRNLVSWAFLGALAVAAACAQGTSDTASAPNGTGFDGGGVLPDGSLAQGDSGDTTRLESDSAVPPPSGDDSAPPPGDDSAAPPPGDDSGSVVPDAGVDSAPPPPVDAGHDSGPVSVVPTTCAQTNEGVGCCVGNDNYYCNQLNSVHEVKCTGGQVCGWDSANKYYGCGNSAGSDPSGTYPIACQ